MGDAKSGMATVPRRSALLHAMRSLVLEKGYDATSLEDVVALAGGSRRNIYAAFGNKAGLLRAAVQELVEDATALDPDDLPNTDDPRAWLTIVGRRFATVTLKPEAMAVMRVFATGELFDAKTMKDMWERGPGRLHETLGLWLIKQRDAGVLNVDDVSLSAEMFPDMVRGSLQLQLLLRYRDRIPEQEVLARVDYAVDLFLKAHGYVEPGE